jgi:hypothetical protein
VCEFEAIADLRNQVDADMRILIEEQALSVAS